MPFRPDRDSLQSTPERLLDTAERCRRLANSVIDRLTSHRLLEMAKECEERAAELRKQTCG